MANKYMFGNSSQDGTPSLDEQIAQMQAVVDSGRNNPMSRLPGGPSLQSYYNQTAKANELARLQGRRTSIAQNAERAAAEYAPYQQAVANQQQILNNSNQRLNEVRSDPMDQMFQDAVKRQLDTKGLETALFAQGSDMATAADNNRQQQMRDQIMQRGGNLNDPSAQAALRASTSQRQGDQQRNAREATLAGYAQGQQGLGAGLAYSSNRNNQLNTATGMANQALSMPVMKRPSVNMTNISSEDAQTALQQGMAKSKPTGPGFQAPSYSEFLKSQNKG